MEQDRISSQSVKQMRPVCPFLFVHLDLGGVVILDLEIGILLQDLLSEPEIKKKPGLFFYRDQGIRSHICSF